MISPLLSDSYPFAFSRPRWLFCAVFNHWLCAFFPFTLVSSYLALSIRGLCLLYRALGIKSDSLRDWMRVAMARCIWEAIHSAGTLWFNLKRDWCWQTSHPLSSKCFLRCPTSIADGQRAHFVMVILQPLSKNNTIKTDLSWETATESSKLCSLLHNKLLYPMFTLLTSS